IQVKISSVHALQCDICKSLPSQPVNRSPTRCYHRAGRPDVGSRDNRQHRRLLARLVLEDDRHGPVESP
ncbi:MAG: hypothetical protein PVJ25_04525, partial [Desulfuromonadales bacterium]